MFKVSKLQLQRILRIPRLAGQPASLGKHCIRIERDIRLFLTVCHFLLGDLSVYHNDTGTQYEVLFARFFQSVVCRIFNHGINRP